MFAMIILAIISLLAWSNFSNNTASIIILITIAALVIYTVLNAKSQKRKEKIIARMNTEKKNL